MSKIKAISEGDKKTNCKNNCCWETSDSCGAQTLRGYLIHIFPIDDDSEGWGYHGNDSPPSNGEYVADHENGYLVAVEEPENLIVVEGWKAEMYFADPGDFFSDGQWAVAVLEAHNSYVTLAGICK